MSELEIEVAPDPEMPDGRHAILRLRGIYLLPTDTIFRIDPADPDVNTNSNWPAGDLRPERTRLGREGLEILLDPQIVTASKLKPGTQVVISVPSAAIRTQLNWPDLAKLPERFDLERTEPEPPVPSSAETSDGLARLQRTPRPAVTSPPPLPSPAALQPATPPPLPASAPSVPPAQQPARRKRAPLFVPFFIGFVAAAGLTLLVWTSLRDEFMRIVPNVEPGQTASAPSVPQLPVAAELDDVFRVGDTSPQGVPAKGLGLERVLSLADMNLYGEKPDPEEARFWLRRAGALVVGEQRFKWALTQLGAIYARESSQEGFAKARALWQLAGGQGDPVALCFLGTLHEYGLGVPKSRLRALAHYEQAGQLGGCKGLDAALARVSGDTPVANKGPAAQSAD